MKLDRISKLAPRATLSQILKSPFFYALLPSILFYTVILSQNWIPIHDAFQVTNITYFIFNEVVRHHSLPLWYPYINYGVDANWYLAFTIGPSLATMLPVAWLLGRGDLLQYYYLSLFLDELILLVGTYLLARALFRSRLTVLFVCVAMTGSTLWYAQPWFNFHLYYFTPLSAYFVVTGAARNELWRVLAGGLVLLISEFGNLPYFAIPHAFTYAGLVAGACWAYRFDLRSALRRRGAREWAVLAACFIAAGIYLLFLSFGVNHINYNVGRTRNLVSAENFLTYGGAIGLSKFTELFTGTSWDLDINAYAGVLVFGSALFGLLWAPERRMAPFFGTAVFFALLSMGKGSFVAPLVYEIPGVAYYRHIGLVLPLVKVMLIVLSGFGFDALIDARNREEKTEQPISAGKRYLSMTAILALMLLLALALTAVAVVSMKVLGFQFVFSELTRASSGFEHDVPQFLSRVGFVVTMYLTAIGVLVVASLRPRTSATVVGIALLIIQGIDVYSYRMFQFQEHMVPINANYRTLFAFAAKPFAAKRTQDPLSNAAFRIVASNFGRPIAPDWYRNCTEIAQAHCYWNFGDTKEGVYYDTVEPFVGMDPCRSIFRVDYWLPGVDVFYRSLTGKPLHDLSVQPQGYKTRAIFFPINDEQLRKTIACEFPKLQLFSSVTVLRNEQEMARLIRDPWYNGDLLLASESDYAEYRTKGGSGEAAGIEEPDVDPSASTRVRGEVRVLGATANTLMVRTVLPVRPDKYWLYFADAWHPFWHAYVNGAQAPILRSDFGFKAVQVPGGVATVTFAYRSHVLSGAFVIAELLLISTMLAVIGVAGRLLLIRTSGEQ